MRFWYGLAFGLCIALLVLFSGCGKKAAKPADLRLKLKAGDQRQIDITSKYTTRTKLPCGKQETQEENLAQRLRFEVIQVNPDGVAEVKMTTRLADNVSLRAFFDGIGLGEKVTAKLNDEITLTMNIHPDGSVENVQGMQAVLDKTVASMEKAIYDEFSKIPPDLLELLGDLTAKTLVDSCSDVLKQALTDEAMKGLAVSTLYYVTPEPVDVGGAWSASWAVSSPIPYRGSTGFGVTGRGNGVVEASYNTSYSPNAAGEIKTGIGNVGYRLSGTETGTIQIDEATGWVLYRKGSIKLDGKFLIGSISLDTSITGATEVRTR